MCNSRLRRLSRRTDAQRVTDRVGKLGAVECVEMEIAHTVSHERVYLLDGNAGRNHPPRVVIFLVAGADKADSLAHVLDGPREPLVYPSQLINGSNVTWFVDEAAATKLRGEQNT